MLETGGFLVGDEVTILLAVQAVPKTEYCGDRHGTWMATASWS